MARKKSSALSDVVRLAEEIHSHAFRLWVLTNNISDLKNDYTVSEADRVAMARLLVTKNVAARVYALVGAVTRLDRLLGDKPVLTQADEAWLRRQLDGLGKEDA
jgi:hypothetical protein